MERQNLRQEHAELYHDENNHLIYVAKPDKTTQKL